MVFAAGVPKVQCKPEEFKAVLVGHSYFETFNSVGCFSFGPKDLKWFNDSGILSLSLSFSLSLLPCNKVQDI
jgi:hypothetical protein